MSHLFQANGFATLYVKVRSVPHLQRAGEGCRVGADPRQPLGGAKVGDLDDAAVRVHQNVVPLYVPAKITLLLRI